MIALEMNDRARFAASEKWPLLFAVAEVYRQHSSSEHPLSAEQVAGILKERFGLEGVDRHAIKRYRKRLEDFFGYRFAQVLRHGFYYDGPDYSLNETEALQTALAVQCNPAFTPERKAALCAGIASLSGSDSVRGLVSLLPEITQATAATPKKDCVAVIRKLLPFVREKRGIRVSFWSQRGMELYPQFLFLKKGALCLVGTKYSQDRWGISQEIYQLDIADIKDCSPSKELKCDPHQTKDGYLVIVRTSKNEEVSYQEYVQTCDETKKGCLHSFPGDQDPVSVKIRCLDKRDLEGKIETIKRAGGFDSHIVLKKTVTHMEKTKKDKPYMMAWLDVTMPEDRLMALLFQNSGWMAPESPSRFLEKYRRKLQEAAEKASLTLSNSSRR